MKKIKWAIILFLSRYFSIFKLILDLRGEYTAPPMGWLTKWLKHKLIKKYKSIYWPVSSHSIITGAEYITVGVGVAPGVVGGCYITANQENPLIIGDYTLISCNVILPGFNHDENDIYKSIGKFGIKIGKYCVLSANSMVFSGIQLGDHTIVAGGAVVTKSFPNGYCVIGGNPARIIKYIEKDKVIEYKFKNEYIGFYPKDKFNDRFRYKFLKT